MLQQQTGFKFYKYLTMYNYIYFFDHNKYCPIIAYRKTHETGSRQGTRDEKSGNDVRASQDNNWMVGLEQGQLK